MKISVIMPSYLGHYDGCASSREDKFKRAVNSFLEQTHTNSELVIVSDGCDITNLLFDSIYSKQPNVKRIKLKKQPLFSGNVRQAGLESATGDVICYLDADDYFGKDHLLNINIPLSNHLDWAYYNDYIKTGETLVPKITSLEKDSVGTSSIAHRKLKGANWNGCDGYGHDWKFIEKLMKYPNFKKIYGCSYRICHIPNQVDA